MTSPGPTLPDAQAVRRLEARARTSGSGLTTPELVGRWRFQQVWPRDGSAPQATASALLRSLDASLEIGSASAGSPLTLCNRVALGPLELRFEGEGTLTGRRPLLRFWFAHWQLRWAGRPWLQRPLPRPAERSLPFFALIGQGSDGEGGRWLTARGRGGGLALWRLEERTAGETQAGLAP